MNPLLTQSAVSLARLIRARRATSLEVVDAHIAQIQLVNAALNAVVKDRFDAARDEARAADARTASRGADELPLFHGVPCTIKESAGLAGMPHSAGLLARADCIATKDGTATARLRAAGAIPLGVTNTSELCMWMESDNRVYGRTSNAYDASRTAGGSSGGEGAIVGAGASPLGLGSDIGGSIRIPAFFNGVFGHKPSGGLVPGTGQFPAPTGKALRFLATGPIVRRAEDLMPALRVMAGPDGEDLGCTDIPLGDPGTVALDGLTVIHVTDNGFLPVSEDLRAAQRRCLYHLASRGALIREARLPALRHSLEIWSSAMVEASGGRTFRDVLQESGVRFRPLSAMVDFALRRSPHTLPAIALALAEGLPRLMPRYAHTMVGLGDELRMELARLIGARGVLLYPPYSSPAPKHRRAMVLPINWVYSAIWNVVETPVTQVPLGLNPQGLPLGVQVIGNHGMDHLTIAVARELERAFGGWVPPPR